MMSFFLPNAVMRPFWTMATMSTATSALGRCAIDLVVFNVKGLDDRSCDTISV